MVNKMNLNKHSKIDLTKYLETKEDIEELLQVSLEDYQKTGDEEEFIAGLRLATKCLEKMNCLNNFSDKTFENKKELYNILDVNTKEKLIFENVVKIINCLGFELNIVPKK